MRYRANVPRFYLFIALAYFQLWIPIWVVFFQERGMSLSQIGALDAAGWVVMALAEVPTGAVADRYGRKVSLALGALLHAAAMFAVTTRVFSPVFLAGYLLWGVSHTFFSGADSAFLYDSLAADGDADGYTRAAGRQMAVVQASQSLASLAGAWLAGFDMTLCFTLSAVAGLLAAAVALTFREPPRRGPAMAAAPGAPGPTPDAPGAAPDTPAAPDSPGPAPDTPAAPGYWRTIGEALAIATRQPAVRYLILLGAVIPVFNFMLTFMLLQPYATGVGAPVSSLGVIVLFVRGASVLGSIAAHRVVSRTGPQALIAGAVAAMIACQALLALLPSPAAIVLFAGGSLASALVSPALSNLLNARIPAARRATVLSLQSLLWTLALAVLEPPLMAVAARAGVPFAVGLCAAALAAVGLPLFLLWRRTAAEPAGA